MAYDICITQIFGIDSDLRVWAKFSSIFQLIAIIHVLVFLDTLYSYMYAVHLYAKH